ncbi:MAG: protein kinase, partial [Polyangiales bacterium]
MLEGSRVDAAPATWWRKRFHAWLGPALEPTLREAFAAELAETNRRRLAVLLPLVLAGHAAHIAVFYTTGERRALLDPQIVRWRDGIAAAHFATLLPLLLFAVVIYARRGAAARWVGPTAATLYLVHGATVAGIDQLVVTAITPFMGYCLGMAVVLVLTPRATLLAYGTGLTAFLLAILGMQPSASARLAIIPNGISTAVVSATLACLLYVARRRDFVQRVTIERQREALSDLNSGLERRVAEQVSEIVTHAEEADRLNAQLQAQVRERSNELALALSKLAKEHRHDGRLRRGALLGERFEIEHVIGEGGMGVVYSGLDRSTGERVAIKVVQAASSQLDAVQRFLREARAAATVTHPGIVRMLHVDVSDDGTLFQA